MGLAIRVQQSGKTRLGFALLATLFAVEWCDGPAWD